MKRITHLNARGEARMVDVGDKTATERIARAEAIVTMKKATLELVTSGHAKKGDVLAVARVAGIQAGKRTPDWIPLCHHVALSSIAIDIAPTATGLRVDVTTRAMDKTGVEMEALVAASAAALTIYDMLKSVDRGMTIAVRLLEKRGGKSDYVRP
ncbi:MAG TPA: cyclic pyranopterin monophosphate synthase MoaC [Polyangiaceae bacterium]|nr:cyclic pyranopterin monophosphate synthase MoaC [Polyangiaceae bacterium]